MSKIPYKLWYIAYLSSTGTSRNGSQPISGLPFRTHKRQHCDEVTQAESFYRHVVLYAIRRRLTLSESNSFLGLGFFFLLGMPVWHTEVPRVGVELELQPAAGPQPQQFRTWAPSVTYTTAHSNAGPLSHWARPGTELVSLRMLVGFVIADPQPNSSNSSSNRREFDWFLSLQSSLEWPKKKKKKKKEKKNPSVM